MNTRLPKLVLPFVLSMALLPVPQANAASTPPRYSSEARGIEDGDVVVNAQEAAAMQAEAEAEMPVFRRLEREFHVPWYYLAAINQYEKGAHWRKGELAKANTPFRVEIPPEKWSGFANPQSDDNNPLTIQMFGGIGLDGNGDKKAERLNPADSMYTIAKVIAKEGGDEDAIRRCIWDFYRDGVIVDRVTGFAHIFQAAGTTNIGGNSFPIPRRYNYSYRSTWGDPRGWGGRRMHEGCDIFANYGTPVMSTAYGMVEVIGWNKFGGWRVGIRDLNNVYHYYAHLGGYEKGLKYGSLVKPGQVIGYVGSSGYGKPGTSGKFAPHLHYGMYRETGTREWAFDPTPHLRKWEREARAKARKNRKRR
ncbi:MAG TPA: M23 family metallopeptidase [Bacilli bacterium]|nr:M23 family metallopeptidase [Bacilli bacterium]